MNKHATHLVFLAVLLIAGCHRPHHHHKRIKFLVTSPLRKDTELTKEYVAQIRAIQHIELRALEKGYLQKVFVDEGQRIPKGTKMFQIMPLIYQAEVQKASAEADLSQIEYNNTKILADKNVVSPGELALAKAKTNKAKAQVALAATHRALTELKAPFDGIVGLFRVRVGSLVDEGDLMTTLSDNGVMWVYFNVSETEYLQYKTQIQSNEPTPVRLLMANGQLFDQTGKIETIEADFNNETGNLAFRATFQNPNGLLRHGETGKILITVPVKDALLVPQKATYDILDRKYVYVVDAKNVVRSRAITVAAETSQLYIISAGLNEKDRIVADGLQKVRDGIAIRVDYKEPSEVFQHLEVKAE